MAGGAAGAGVAPLDGRILVEELLDGDGQVADPFDGHQSPNRPITPKITQDQDLTSPSGWSGRVEAGLAGQ